MSGYDYGNARLRALKSHLLSRRDLDNLAETGNLDGLIAALVKTAYHKAVEAALTRTSGLDCIAESLHYDMVTRLGKIQAFYDGQSAEMVAIVLRSYDLHNLKCILRGLTRHAMPGEILVNMIPVGLLKDGVLEELARSPDPRAAIDTLASMALPLAQPLLKLRAEQPGAGTVEMELRLEQWFYHEVFQYLQDSRSDGNVLFEAVQLEADLTNLLVVLRFAHEPGERKFLSEWLQIGTFESLFVGPGRLPFNLLSVALNQDTLDAAVETLAETPYAGPLKAGLKAYTNTALLSEFEKQLKRLRLAWMAGQIAKDPLGIGVVIGYLALKVNEVNNLRWIAQGIQLGLQGNAIRAELEYPP